MRLIDADALIEAIEDIKLYNVTPGQPVFDMNRVRADELIETINSQPTAYDAEKVVEQIREFVECNDECEKKFYYGQGCSACMWGKMVELVKKGGID